MKIISVVNGPKNISAIVQGCMRMPALSKEDAAKDTTAVLTFMIMPHVTAKTERLKPDLPRLFL